MSTFTFVPDFDASASVEPRVRRTQFMDGGYEHRLRFGLNTRPRTYEFTFGNRPDSEADQIEAFFNDLAGAEAFDWTSSIETQRNLLSYTDDLTQSVWTSFQLTSVGPGQLGYAGGSNAFGLISNTVNAQHWIQQQFTVAASTNAVHSVFVKQSVGRDVQLYALNAAKTQSIGVGLNFSTSGFASINSSGVSLTDFGAVRIGSDGWWRIWVTGRPDNSTTRILQVVTFSSTGSVTYAGDGSTPRVLMMGPQVEYGSLTGYQPIAAAEATKKWVCERWQRRYINCNNNTITATFRQVYES